MSGADCPFDELVFLYLDPTAPAVTVGKMSIMLVSLSTAAFFTWELARRIASLVVPGSDDSRYAVSLAGIGIVCGYVAINMLGEVAMHVVFSLGNVGIVILAYVLPPLYYVLQFKTASMFWLLASIVVFLIGLVLVVLAVVALVAAANP
jgi:hypothetical protein